MILIMLPYGLQVQLLLCLFLNVAFSSKPVLLCLLTQLCKEYYSKSNNVFFGEQLLVNSDISANFDTLLASSIANGAI